MVNEEGKKGRDREISFKIEAYTTNAYIGRSVSVEAINEVLGKEPTEEDLQQNINHYTEDYFLCSNCEKRISHIESYYSTKGKVNGIPHSIISNEVESELAILFWISIVWRISVTDIPGPKLQPKERERLRNTLNACLGNSIEEIKINTKKHISLMKEIRTIVLYEAPNANPTGKMYSTNSSHRFPYSYIINDYVLYFYFKKKHTNALKKAFFGLEKFQQKRLLNSINSKNEILYIISEDDANKAREEVNLIKVKERLSNVEKIISTYINRLYPQLNPYIHHNIKTAAMQELIEKDQINMLGLETSTLHNAIENAISNHLNL